MFGQASGASAADAAMINGGLIHSLEFDDTHIGSIAHGSAVLAAGALAVAEAQKASGAALLGAYARGWEVLIRFGLAAPNGFHAKGFMSTSVTGTLAVALLAAQLMRLDEDRTLAAIGIALSQASGVMEFLTNGSSVKSLHPGWAAHGGVVAAMLARAGMTGPETSLDGRHGLFRQFTGDEGAAGRFRTLIGGLGREWHLPKAAYKFYPCCHYLHPFIEAAGQLAERGVRANDVEHIVCRVPQGEAAVICEPWETKQAPATGHAARWSLPIAVAARLVEGKSTSPRSKRRRAAPCANLRGASLRAAAASALSGALRSRTGVHDEKWKSKRAHRRCVRQSHPAAGRGGGADQIPRQRRALAQARCDHSARACGAGPWRRTRAEGAVGGATGVETGHQSCTGSKRAALSWLRAAFFCRHGAYGRGRREEGV